MKILGDKNRTLLTKNGFQNFRIEAFQDDRFRFMFVSRGVDGGVMSAIPFKVRKGTKELNLDSIWPTIEKAVKSA